MFALPEFYQVLLLWGELVSAGGTNEEILFPIVPAKHLLLVTRGMFREDTNAPTYVQFLVRGRGKDIAVFEQRTVTAGVMYNDGLFVLIPENCQLVARFNGSTAANLLWAAINGYEVMASKITNP